MCPGLGEWWLHKGVLNLQNLVIFNIYAQIVSRIPCRHFEMASKTKYFIYADRSFYLSGGRCQPLPTIVGTSLF